MKFPSDRDLIRSGVPILVILLIGVALRFHQLGYKSLWVDEIGEVVMAQGGLAHAILAAREHVAAAPLDYVVTWMALRLGEGEFILRFAPALWSMLALAVTFQLTRALVGSDAVANLVALLLAFSPAAVHYAQEVRFYALGTLLLLAGVLLFVRAWQVPTRRRWVAFALTLLCSMYAHYYAVWLAGGLLCFATFVWVGARVGLISDNLGPARVSGLVTACAISVLLFAPWLLYAGRGALSYRPFDLPTAADIFIKPVLGAENGTNLLLWFVGGLVLPFAAGFGVLTLWRARSPWSILLLLFSVASVIVVLVGDAVAGYPYAPRQLVFFVPYYLISVAVGFHAAWRALQSFRALKAIVALVLMSVLGWVVWSGLDAYYNHPKDDWHSAARLIERAIQPGDAIRFTQVTLPTYLNFYSPGLYKYSSERGGGAEPHRLWIIGWGPQSQRRAYALVPSGWKVIALNAETGVDVLYSGKASEPDLWREASAFALTPQVLAYTDILRRAGEIDPQLGLQVAAQARAALANPQPPLLDAQRAVLEEKLAAVSH